MVQQRNSKKQLWMKVTQQDSNLQTHEGLSFENPQEIGRLWFLRIPARQMWFDGLASVIFFHFVYGSDSKCFQGFVKGGEEM